MQMILLRRLKFGLDYNFHFTFVVYEEDYLQTEKSTAYPGWALLTLTITIGLVW